MKRVAKTGRRNKTQPSSVCAARGAACPANWIKYKLAGFASRWVFVGLLLAPQLPVCAQKHDLSWFTIDGGSGTSTGGVYSVSGTIGQPDAGVLSGGNYTLVGGFSGFLAAVQTPGAPPLTIRRTTTNSVIVAWQAPSAGWQLQQNPGLTANNWADVTTPPIVVNGENQVVVAPPVGNKFYRLRKL